MSQTSFIVSVVSLLLLVGFSYGNRGDKLKMKYYHESCPSFETTVRDITWREVGANRSLAAKLLRLQYHDCFVRGCDASILLDSTDTNASEKKATPNLSLSGYDVIDKIKTKLEQDCPGIVSCADILALATRDAVSHQFQRSLWPVFTGRKDGRVSLSSEVSSNLPSPFANFSTLLGQFLDKGLDLTDLVVLSGAHTIGVTHCSLVGKRIYNFTGKGDADPSLNRDYATTLRALCPTPPSRTTIIEMDPQSSLSFDSDYYKAVNQRMGIFQSDAALLNNRRSARLVRFLQSPILFFNFFAQSMKKMGEIGVLTGNEGEIRANCRVVNT